MDTEPLFLIVDDEHFLTAGGAAVRALVCIIITVLLVAFSQGCGDELTIICTPMELDAGRRVALPPGEAGGTGVPAPTALDAAARDAVASTSASPDGGGNGPAPACPPEDARRVQVVTGEITADTTWSCESTYLLGGYVIVKSGATLMVRPGTVIKGDGTSALLITREGRLIADGEPTRPIVFTSVAAVGSRNPGGWQGVVLLGNATLNGAGERELEGLTTNNPDYRYGGSDDAHDCGTLRYVRIEFAGHELQPNKELNSLTVAGCGSGTTIDYVQLHKGKDDGIEFFGGTASAKHLVITGADDDSIDWDEGYRGRLQFVAIQQHELSGAGDSNGIEASNRAGSFDAMPYSSPIVYNVTMIGVRQSYNQVRALLLKEGTRGQIRSLIALGFASVAIDVVSSESAAALLSSPPTLAVSHSIFDQIGPDGSTYFPLAAPAESSADGNLAEDQLFTAAMQANRFGVDPRLPAPYDVTKPGWVPPIDSPAAMGSSPLPDDRFFDLTANFVGAFRPGGQDWTAGWTAYPVN